MGLAHAAGAASSSQQAMLVAFVDVQASVAIVLVVEPLGGEARLAVGSGLTTCHVFDERAKPQLFVARTTKVWLPKASFV